MATVLVVEDEFGIADLIEAVLTDEGHRVVMAANGKQGLEVLAKEHPDLMFLDYMMPVMDGAAMLRAMGEHPSLEGYSGRRHEFDTRSDSSQRCSGYTSLRKPFNIRDVEPQPSG